MWLWIPIVALCAFYCVMVFLFWIGVNKSAKREVKCSGEKVQLSLIIPFRNEEQNLENLLESISNQDFLKDHFEIILVNDNSTDKSFAIAKDWEKRMENLSVLSLPESKRGKKEALSHGISHSKNSIVVLTDADCTHPAGWLSAISNSFAQSDLCLLIGLVRISPTNTFFQKVQALEHASLTASTLGACELGFPIMASSANLAFDKSKVGYDFHMLNPNQPSGDDVFLLHNAKRKCAKKIQTLNSIDGIVFTKPTSTLKEFLFQRARWASKAPAYNDLATIIVAMVVFLFNLSLVGLAIGAFFKPKLLPMLVFAFLLKILVDFPLLFSFQKKIGETSLMYAYFPVQIIYPLYIVITFCISLVLPVKWK